MNVDQDAVLREWAGRGFHGGLWIDPPGQVWPDFVHSTDELVMPVEGEIELEFGGHVHRPKVGAELLIPAGESHTVRNVGGTVARWLYAYRRD